METRQTVSHLHAELSERDDYVGLLRKEHQKITKDTASRTSYTKRILEILANIKKQRLDIDKIIKDTRIIQKDINYLAGRLDRAFTETDELMFRDAKSDEFVRKAYKNVATFHESCATLIQAVEATGSIMREMKDLEDEASRSDQSDLPRHLKYDWLFHRLIDWLIDWLMDCLIDWLIDWLIDCFIDWLIDWLFDCSFDWSIDWLIDWLIDWFEMEIETWKNWEKIGIKIPFHVLWQVDAETKKSKEQSLQRIQDDLKAIKAENVALAARLA